MFLIWGEEHREVVMERLLRVCIKALRRKGDRDILFKVNREKGGEKKSKSVPPPPQWTFARGLLMGENGVDTGKKTLPALQIIQMGADRPIGDGEGIGEKFCERSLMDFDGSMDYCKGGSEFFGIMGFREKTSSRGGHGVQA